MGGLDSPEPPNSGPRPVRLNDPPEAAAEALDSELSRSLKADEVGPAGSMASVDPNAVAGNA